MAALGARFMVWNGCFHYLIPASWLDGELDGNPAPFAIYSCLYDPKTRELTLRDIAPFEDHVAWEERAKEIGIKLLDQDPNKLLRD